MKKAIIFSVLILCGISVFARNKMDKATFGHWVDYANCQYLMAFIEKNDAGKHYIKDTYEKSVKPELQKATLDDLTKVPTIDKIKGLFSNSSNNLALKLAEKINERKNKYNTLPDNNSLVKELSTTGWNNVDLTSVAIKIQNSIRTKYNAEPKQAPKSVSEQEVVKNQTIQTSSQVDELQAKIDNLQQQYENLKDDSKLAKLQGIISTLRLLVFICLGLFVLLFIVLFLWYKKQFNAENRSSSVRKFVKDVFFLSEEIKEELSSLKQFGGNGNNSNVSMFEDKLNKLERQLGELSEKVRDVNQTNPNQQTPQQTNNVHQQGNNNSPKDSSLYFASKSEKQLTEPLTNSVNASFKVYAANGNEAKFDYIGTVRNENWFEGICTIENAANDNLSDKKQINTTQAGKVKKENNNWVVITPAKIKFL